MKRYIYSAIGNIDDEDPNELIQIAKNPNTRKATLSKLATSNGVAVRYYTAFHPNISIETLTKLAHDKDSNVREAIASNKNITDEIAILLAKDKDEFVCYALAKNPYTCSAALDTLSRRKLGADWEDLYEEIAKNPNASAQTLSRLANWFSNQFFIAKAIAENTNTPTEVLDKMYKVYKFSDFDSVLCQIAQNPNVSLKTLLDMQKEEFYFIDTHTCNNPKTIIKSLEKKIKQMTK